MVAMSLTLTYKYTVDSISFSIKRHLTPLAAIMNINAPRRERREDIKWRRVVTREERDSISITRAIWISC